MRNIVFLLTGALFAGAGVFIFMAKDTERALTLFQTAECARASSRAMQAYQHEEPGIAVWELHHLADIETEYLQRGGGDYGSNGMKSALMVTRSRLAKLYHQQGRKAEAQTNANAAIQLFSELAATNASVTNLESLLECLSRADAQAKREPRYE